MINPKFNFLLLFIVYISFFEHKNEASSFIRNNDNDQNNNSYLLSLKNKRDVWNLTLINLTLFTNNSISIRNLAPSYSTRFIKQQNISADIQKPGLLHTAKYPVNTPHQTSKPPDNSTSQEIFQLVVEKIVNSTRPYYLGSNLGYKNAEKSEFIEKINKICQNYGLKAKSVHSFGSDNNVSLHENYELSLSKADVVTDGRLIKLSHPLGNFSQNLKHFDTNDGKKQDKFIVSNVVNEPDSKRDGKFVEQIENKLVKSVHPSAIRQNKTRTSTEEVSEESDDDNYSVVESSGSTLDDSKAISLTPDETSSFFKATTAGDMPRVSLSFQEKVIPLNPERLSDIIKTIRLDKPEFYRENLELPFKNGYAYLNKRKNNFPILYHDLGKKIVSNKNKNHYSDIDDLFNVKNHVFSDYDLENSGKNYLGAISNYFGNNGLLNENKNKQSKASLEKGLHVKDIIETNGSQNLGYGRKYLMNRFT